MPARLRSVAAAGATALATLTLLGACQSDTAPPEAPADPVTNEALNVSFDRLPQGYEVASNDADGLRLRSTDPEVEAEYWLEVGETSDFGIDLVALVNGQREQYEALPGGSYSGATKLVTPMGEAYNVRGQYEWEGARVEEARVLVVHPAENRLATFHARYPAGGQEISQSRIGTLLEWVGELQALNDPYTDPGDADGDGGDDNDGDDANS